MTNVIIVVCTVAVAGLLLFALHRLYRKYTARSLKRQNSNSSVQSYEVKVNCVEASMEEGHSVKKEEPVEQEDDKSTGCPSLEEKRSEPSICGDSDKASERSTS